MEYLHFDVFTDRPFTGNQLAVFPDARGLDAVVMQQIAREMAFSETTFILPAERPDTDVRMRIFTPAAELPMAGHPTVGTTFALAHTGTIVRDRTTFTFGLDVGPTPVRLQWEGGVLRSAWMTQPVPTFGTTLADLDAIAAALSIEPAPIRATGLPVQDVSSGVPFVFVPIASRDAVDRTALDLATWRRCCETAGLPERPVFLFSLEPGLDGAIAYSRMFAPLFGIAEDPATGAASGPLGAYLVRYKLVPPENANDIVSLQGQHMGRPSRIHIAVRMDGDAIGDVQVGGGAVLVGEGVLRL